MTAAVDLGACTALVTGANRGLGRALTEELLARGVRRVYAAVRTPADLDLPGAVPLRLDLTDPASITAAARQAGDVDLLVNNAGVLTGAPLSSGDLDRIRLEMETNFFGPLLVSRAFAPVLARNGGGVLVNVLSVLSWLTLPTTGSYSAAKAAAWQPTNALRLELAAQRTRVVAVHAAFIDTEMTRGLDVPKSSPQQVAATVFDGVASGAVEVLTDDLTADVRRRLAGGVPDLYPQPSASG